MKQARQGRAGPGSFFRLRYDAWTRQPRDGREMEYLKGGVRDLISCHFLAIFKSQRTVYKKQIVGFQTAMKIILMCKRSKDKAFQVSVRN